jgi:2-polyprenyl-6-methoxyphenol hydroxylase-like FAD-dependent oxidoreductase
MSIARAQEETSAHCDVFIQGAGIGGLTLAIALQQRGYKIRVVERAAGLAEVGAGIWMAANPMQVFARLGFAEKIIEAGWTVKLLRLQDWKSGDLQTTNMSQIAKEYGFETIALHRGVLQRLLFEQVEADAVRFGCDVKLVTQNGDQVLTATRFSRVFPMDLPAQPQSLSERMDSTPRCAPWRDSAALSDILAAPLIAP